MNDDLTLVEVLATAFSLDELEFLALRLGMNPTEPRAPHDTPRTFALKLHHYFESRGQLAELEAEVHQERPHLGWRSPGKRGATRQPARLYNVPDKPRFLIPREAEAQLVRVRLLANVAGAEAESDDESDPRYVGVWGGGGMGKSALATVLAHDTALRAHFPHGIFWLTVGKEENREQSKGASEARLLAHQTNIAEELGYSGSAFTDLHKGRARLRELLADRCCLLVLDDVWQSKDADHFLFDERVERSRLLLTTRNEQVLNELESFKLELTELNPTQALALLAQWAKQKPETLPPEASDIAYECGNLPLALAMVGARIGDRKDTWESALKRLKEQDLEKIERPLREYVHPNLWRAIAVSIDALPDGLGERYADFTLFPPTTPIPSAVLRTLWQHQGLAKEYVTSELRRLTSLSLARWDDKTDCLTLHNLQLSFLQKKYADVLPHRHEGLLKAYAEKCAKPGCWASGPKDGYFFQHLPHHLLEAGRAVELAVLLLDYHWLRARLHATDIFTLLDDFKRLPLPLSRYQPTKYPSPGRPGHALSALYDTLRQSAHVLARDKDQLPAHLLGRLLDEPLPPLTPLLEQASQNMVLGPLRATLEPPGGPLLRTLEGHRGRVTSVALSGDGQWAISASADRTLKVWEVATGREQHTLKGHTGGVNSVALSGDGRLAVTASSDRTLKVWEVATGRERYTLKEHTGGVNSVALSGDGRLAVSASADRTLKVWEVDTGRVRYTLKGHTGGVNSVALSENGRLAVTASDDSTLKVWDLDTGKESRTLSGHEAEVLGVALRKDGRLAVSASKDGTLKVWDLTTGDETQTLKGHEGEVQGVALSSDGQVAVSASKDGTLKVWNLATGDETHTLPGHTDWVWGVALNGDGRLAVSASADRTLKVWEVTTMREHLTLSYARGVGGVALNRDGQMAVSASDDGTLKVWEVATGRELRTLEGHEDWVRGVALSGDGRLAISASDDWTLNVWEVETGRKLRPLMGHKDWVRGVALSRDGEVAISASLDRTLKVWEVATGRVRHTLAGHTEWVLGVALSEDGRLAISASADGTLKMWDTDTGQELYPLVGHAGGVWGVALSKDRQRVVSASEDRTLKVWEVATGREVHTLIGHTAKVNSVALSADGCLAVSASDDRTLKVWDLKTRDCLATFDDDQALYCCAFAPPFIVAGGQSGRVHFLRLMNDGG